MARVKAEFFETKDKATGETKEVQFIPPVPSGGDLGGISQEKLEQIDKLNEDMGEIEKSIFAQSFNILNQDSKIEKVYIDDTGNLKPNQTTTTWDKIQVISGERLYFYNNGSQDLSIYVFSYVDNKYIVDSKKTVVATTNDSPSNTKTYWYDVPNTANYISFYMVNNLNKYTNGIMITRYKSARYTNYVNREYKYLEEMRLVDEFAKDVCKTKKTPNGLSVIPHTFSKTTSLPDGVTYYGYNKIFRYRQELVDKEISQIQMSAKGNGFTCEFYYSGTEIEFYVYGTTRFTVAVNGKYTSDSFICPSIEDVSLNGQVYVKMKLPDGENKLIQIYIYGVLIGVRIDKVSNIKPYIHDRPLLICEGDSITEASAVILSGNGVSRGYMAKIGQAFDWDVLDCAVGGSGYLKTGNQGQPNMLERFDSYVLQYQPDIFIASAGLNDYTQDLEKVKSNITQYWNNAKEKLNTDNIIIMSPFSPFGENEKPQKFLGVCEHCRKTAIELELPYIDTVHGKTYDANGGLITSCDDGIINTDNKSMLIGDGTHLNFTGHDYMYKRVSTEIWKLLKNQSGLLIN